ncbi:MAG: hypothetical protein KA313_04995 [Pseudarcicella sp.]|nr:hypothetical protein [Pseudarcicella sp.]MBP6410436.1 hypothetical protein [Pseudarcicella sp.]
MSKQSILSFTLLFLFASVFGKLYGQGCSDAGFCTINSFKPGTIVEKENKNQLSVGTFLGKADNSITAYGSYLEYNRQLSSSFGIETKISMLAQNGNNVNEFGFSDIFLNVNYKTLSKVKFTLGFKIPLSEANKVLDNNSLPMDYQASLGTFDVLFGLGYEIGKLQLVTALQQPLNQNNNKFLATNFSSNSELSKFQSTNQFSRRGDVLLRISYPMFINSKLKFTPSVLPIYHLGNDSYVNETGSRVEIDKSEGFTLNGNLYLDYELNKKNVIQLSVGVPFVVRNSRPDGLTRSFIANFVYGVKF